MAVVGAGNVAMDAARCALRLGAEEVHIVYRRSREEVPARAEEVHHAEEEGIIFDFLTNPIEMLGNDKGWVTGMRCIRMELGEPDASGRRRPVPDRGLRVRDGRGYGGDGAGHAAQPAGVHRCARRWSARARARWWPTSDTGRTKLERVWAGGDIVTGAATVISAMGAGRIAATDIDAYLMSAEPGPWLAEAAQAS